MVEGKTAKGLQTLVTHSWLPRRLMGRSSSTLRPGAIVGVELGSSVRYEPRRDVAPAVTSTADDLDVDNNIMLIFSKRYYYGGGRDDTIVTAFTNNLLQFCYAVAGRCYAATQS